MSSADTPSRRKNDPPDLSRIHALVVDDDENYRIYIAALLRRAGVVVHTATDGGMAVELIRAGRHFDLFFIDYEMPRIDGLQLISMLRDEPATASGYAVMLTGRGELETKIAALTAGFDDFLVKAATELELVAKIVASKRLVMRQQTVDATLRELRGLASTDELTGLLNRRFFIDEAARMLGRTDAVALVVFDLDGFKSVNDRHGHLVGDTVLRDVAEVLKRNTRYEDFVVRYGGDEFVMMAHGVTLGELDEVVRRIASKVDALRWDANGEVFGIGITAGVATTELLPDRKVETLLEAADRDLYTNKFVKRGGDESHSYDYGRKGEAKVVEFRGVQSAAEPEDGRGESNG